MLTKSLDHRSVPSTMGLVEASCLLRPTAHGSDSRSGPSAKWLVEASRISNQPSLVMALEVPQMSRGLV